MDFLNVLRRFAFGRDKNLVAGQKALERIQELLLETIAKYDGVPQALTLEEIAPIKVICDQLVLANFQLTVPSSRDSGPKRPMRVHYKHVYEDKMVSIGIFILPPGVSIPLHDHPRMSVITRVLYGSMHVKTYDLIKHDGLPNDKKHMARLCMDKVATAPHTMELLPDYGNLHQLVGGDDIGCAFLDIITPPYDSNKERDCTYYRVINSIANPEDVSEKLVELESYEPKDFDVILETYYGPHL
ncbi:unnamed protein product [Peronospora farinosa]|uniref:Cysteine dioxygenase n=1 Tax=Peronospora farinosa TaxID=134698 RepID=A0AAV0TJM4_9STRA|nr:unnamed protein product [Peronospora farinosa]CAI5720742.1 unnamed protein product [Peronospora farinosa]